MKLTESLDGLGPPVAYYPELARFFGSVPAAILFQQLWYWRDKAKHDYQFHTAEKIEQETGLNPREQRRARAVLTEAGAIKTTYARLQHEMRFWILSAELNAAWAEWADAGKPDRLKLSTKAGKQPRKSNGKFASPRTPQNGLREHRKTAVGRPAIRPSIPESTPETTTEITPPPLKGSGHALRA